MMLADFHFLRPWWLLSLIPAGVLFFLLIKNKYRRGDWAEICDRELLPYILQEQPAQTNSSAWFGGCLAALLCILAMAGPTWERLPGPAFRNDSALVIALDLSKSMNAADIKPSRITRARYKIADILKQRKDGQTALLVYGGDAFTVTPLTTDTATINSQLEALDTDIMPSPGSHAGAAIEKAVELLRQAGLAQGQILLVTDGVDAESVEHAHEELGDYHLSVLAVGTADGAPIPVPGGGFLKDSLGNIVVAKLDSEQLRELASEGHGLYQAVTANDDDVELLGKAFNDAENQDKVEQIDVSLQQWDEKGPWLLLAVLPWAALRFRRGLLAFLLLTIMLPLPNDAWAFDWQGLWQNQNQKAQQAFQQQQYQEAADQFDDPDWRAAAQYKAGQYQEAADTLKDTQSADGHYNRGNALAKTGQLQEALTEYDQALKLDPNNEDAKTNFETTKEALEEQQKKEQDKNKGRKNCSEEEKNTNPECVEKGNKPSEDGNEQQQSDKQDQGQHSSQQDQSDQQDQSQTSQNPQEQPSQESEQSTPDKQEAEQNQGRRPQPEQQTDKPDEARRSSNNPKPEKAAQTAADELETEQEESDRANEQLLKRIPDEPTGLLMRKFKYQYGQRDPPPSRGPDW